MASAQQAADPVVQHLTQEHEFPYKPFTDTEAVIGVCSDRNLYFPVEELLTPIATYGLDRVIIPGAVRPGTPSTDDDLFLGHHHGAKVYAKIGHSDCGAYGAAYADMTPADRDELVKKDLREWKAQVLEKKPDAVVVIGFWETYTKPDGSKWIKYHAIE